MSKLSAILLIDDDETTNFLNEHLLTKLDIADHILVARNGEEALRLLAEVCVPASPNCPELILLDLNMPVMSGIGFLEAFQPAPPAPPIHVVILTTTMHPHDLARLRALPHAGLLQKPLTREKIDTVLKELFHCHLPEAASPADQGAG